MKKKILILGAVFLVLFANAQTEKKDFGKFTLNGSVDGYFRANLNGINKTYADSPNQLIAPPTSFADKTGFALGMANVIGSYEHKNVGAVIDLAFGPRGKQSVFNSTGSSNIVNQAYVYWNTNDKLKFTMGQFNTFLGYEVISPVSNFNYSTSYLFSYGPFNHTGIKANYQIDNKWSAMLSFTNPCDILESNPVWAFTTGAQIAYAGEKEKIYFNFLYGDQDGKLSKYHGTIGDFSRGKTFQADFTANFNLTNQFYLGLNTSYNVSGKGEILTTNGVENAGNKSSGFYGVALYPQYKFSEKNTLGLRAEYFSEFKGGVGALKTYDSNGKANAVEITLTDDIKIGESLTVKPELRYDTDSQNIYTKNENGTSQKNLFSFALATIYKF